MNQKDDVFNVRIGHFISDMPAVDILVDGFPVLTGRDFGEINDYTSHGPSEYDITVRGNDDEEPILEEPIDFKRGRYYTLLLVGTMAKPEFRLLIDG